MSRYETSSDFVQALARQFPKLQQLLDEHVADNDELLPHVLFGDLTRLAQLSAESSVPAPHLMSLAELSTLIGTLESAICGPNLDIVDLILVSFLENLEPDRASYEVIKSLMGSGLRKGLSLFEA